MKHYTVKNVTFRGLAITIQLEEDSGTPAVGEVALFMVGLAPLRAKVSSVDGRTVTAQRQRFVEK